MQATYTHEYVPPILTVDSVIFQLIDNTLHVLLIQRTNEPFVGAWALPGGYMLRAKQPAKQQRVYCRQKAACL